MVSSGIGENSISTKPLAVTLVSKSIGLKDPANACSPVLDKRFPKVILKVGPTGEEIVANPQFLTMGSPFFNQRITKDNQSEPIVLHSLDPSAVHLILTFLYTGYLEIREKNVRGLLLAAIEFEISEVRTSCYEFLTAGLNCHNYWDVRQFGDNYRLQLLSDNCEMFLVEHFRELTETAQFLALDYPEVYIVFIRSQVNPEVRSMDVLNALIKWGNYKVDERTQYLHRIARQINLMEIVESHSALALKNAFMGDDSPLRNCQDCKNLYLQALESIVFEKSQSSSKPNIHTERVQEPDINIIKVEEDVVVHTPGYDDLSDSHFNEGGSSVVSSTRNQETENAGNQQEAPPSPFGQNEQESREDLVESKPGPSPKNTTPTTSNTDANGAQNGESSLWGGSEKFWPSKWLSEVEPKQNPYYPQIGDDIVYFRDGHELYLEEVMERGMYAVTHEYFRTLPWNLIPNLPAEVPARVVDIKFLIKPPRLVSLKLGIVDWKGGKFTGGYINEVAYHYYPGLNDFIILRQRYDKSIRHNWKASDRFRCLSGTEWQLGTISGFSPFNKEFPTSTFLCQKILWDNKEKVDGSLSPWDIEIIPSFGALTYSEEGIPATEAELKSVLYEPNKRDWRRGSRDAECIRISTILQKVMELKIAQSFLTPVDLNFYPNYAHLVEYFVDLSMIKARVQNRFYRRMEALEFDIKKLASNTQQFNKPRSGIVNDAKIVRDVCLLVIRQPGVTEVKSALKAVINDFKFSDSEEEDDEDLLNSSTVKRIAEGNSRTKRQRTVKHDSEDDEEENKDEKNGSKTKSSKRQRTPPPSGKLNANASSSSTNTQVRKRKKQ